MPKREFVVPAAAPGVCADVKNIFLAASNLITKKKKIQIKIFKNSFVDFGDFFGLLTARSYQSPHCEKLTFVKKANSNA